MRTAAAESAPLLYERLATHVSDLVERGALRPGDRLPSVRRMSRQQHVSVATVLAAYVALENRGVIEARPQSGHYVKHRRAPALPEPRPCRVSAASSRVEVAGLIAKVYRAAGDPKIVPLGAACPSPELLPVDRLGRILSGIARSAGNLAVSYDPPPGCPALRRQIARRAVDWGCSIAPDDIVTTVGAMEALHLSLRAVAEPGDTVAVESPAYYGLLQLLESHSIRALEIPAHPRTGMDLDVLEAALDAHPIKACLAIPNFSNPLGSAMPDAHKERLVHMLARREVPLIEDDLSGDLHFSEERPRPAKAFDDKGLVLLCGSFSKTIAPGYRVGWVAPGRFRDRVERLKFAQSVSTPTALQLTVAEFLDSGGYDRHLRRMRRCLADQVAHVSAAIAEHFPPGTRVSRPAGGFVLWVELRPGTSGLTLHERALAENISIAPGPIFTAKPRYANCIRISCGYPWSPVIERAIATLGRLAMSS